MRTENLGGLNKEELQGINGSGLWWLRRSVLGGLEDVFKEDANMEMPSTAWTSI
ncbi:MAG: hypothetical protein AAF717_17825 [Bacteroidota bacterium]